VVERVKPGRSSPVGYRRPPKEAQFKPGRSGNPTGRPRGTRSPAAIFQAIIEKKVPVTENGRTRNIPVLEVAFLRLAQDAMRGNEKAIKLLVSLVDRYGVAPEAKRQLEDLLAEDRDILGQFLPESSLRDTSGPKPDAEER
jgi:hypothetical protein